MGYCPDIGGATWECTQRGYIGVYSNIEVCTCTIIMYFL